MILAAAVLAGGRSRRMGRNKALVEVDGVAMADRVLGAARAVGATPVIVYGGNQSELSTLSADVITDAYPGEGPVGGVLGALRHFEGVADRVLVLPCDVPHITTATLEPLLDAAAGDGFSQVWVAAVDRLEPMCAIWSIDSIPLIQAMYQSGERALHKVIGGLPHVAVTVDGAGLTNINTPDDLGG